MKTLTMWLVATIMTMTFSGGAFAQAPAMSAPPAMPEKGETKGEMKQEMKGEEMKAEKEKMNSEQSDKMEMGTSDDMMEKKQQ
jgi:hypothetical protein